MSSFAAHPSGDQFVLDADVGTMTAIANIVRQAHRPGVKLADLPEWRQDLSTTFDRIFEQLPRYPTYRGLPAMVAAQETPHVTFVSHSARVVVGVDRFVMEGLADCLRLALADAADPDFLTITGADLGLVRRMFLAVSAALGTFAEAHKITFP